MEASKLNALLHASKHECEDLSSQVVGRVVSMPHTCGFQVHQLRCSAFRIQLEGWRKMMLAQGLKVPPMLA